jgi:hypothetical protein
LPDAVQFHQGCATYGFENVPEQHVIYLYLKWPDDFTAYFIFKTKAADFISFLSDFAGVAKRKVFELHGQN